MVPESFGAAVVTHVEPGGREPDMLSSLRPADERRHIIPPVLQPSSHFSGVVEISPLAKTETSLMEKVVTGSSCDALYSRAPYSHLLLPSTIVM